MIESGPVFSQPPHVTAESDPIKTPSRETRVYWPQLIVNGGESTTFEVTVTVGKVVERIVVTGDAIAYHQADNHFDPADPVLKKFGISVGQSIYVKVEVLPTGAVGVEDGPPPPIVTLVVSDAGEESTHYQPPIGESEGAPGTYYYELAQLISDSFGVRFRYNMAGRNIDHWMDLPTFENAGGETIWKEWDADAGVYKTKGIEGIRQIEVTGAEDTIQVGGNNKDAKFVFKESGSSEGAEGEEINFNDGLNTDGEAPGDEPPDPKNIILPIVQGISPILVERSGAGNRTFTVSLDEAESGDNFNVELLSVNLFFYGEDVTVSTDSGPRMWYVRNGRIKLTDDMAAGLAVYQLILKISAGSTESGPGYTEPD
jgi:hypothetical protein